MQFYSGFSLEGEGYLFEHFIDRSDFTICGFSYGAIGALHRTLQALKDQKRIDRLQLFSPIFFQTKEAKFKRLQLQAYTKDEALYMKNFLNASFAPYKQKILKHKETTFQELYELLEYVWDREELSFVIDKGVKIEVYLGGQDSIIDVEAAREFFLPYATLTYIKNANHFLQLD